MAAQSSSGCRSPVKYWNLPLFTGALRAAKRPSLCAGAEVDERFLFIDPFSRAFHLADAALNGIDLGMGLGLQAVDAITREQAYRPIMATFSSSADKALM